MLLFALAFADEDDRMYIENLYHHFCYLMYAVARKYAHSPADVEDIVADSCLHLFLNQDELKKMNSQQLQRYIMVVVRNVAINFCKREHHKIKPIEANGFDALYSLEEEILLHEQMRRIRQAIALLPEKERKALRMKIHDRRDDAEIATALGISKNSVRKYISRARQRLRQALEKENDE